jgi:hypothetical protein
MVVAALGLPAGLEIRPAQPAEIISLGTVDHCEIRGREVVCYWRKLGPESKVHLTLDVRAAVPGQYTGPPSSVYLYHVPEDKHWSPPLSVEIKGG